MPAWGYIENIVTVIAATSLTAFLTWWTGSLWGLLALVVLLNVNYIRRRTAAKE
jgi:hypothetical protein